MVASLATAKDAVIASRSKGLHQGKK